MLPSNVLDEPAKKLRDLAELAKVTYDPRFSVIRYVRSAQGIIQLAEMAYIEGNLETSYINYLKAVSIVLEVVQQDKDFEKQKLDPEYLAMRKNIIDTLPKIEAMKETLLAKYRTMQEIDAEALETAAKGGKPKPPPRPSKPAFLSSNKYDGQSSAPVAPKVIALPTSPPNTEPSSRSSTSLSGKIHSAPIPIVSSAINNNYPSSSSPSVPSSIVGTFPTPGSSPLLPSMTPLQPASYNLSSQNGLASHPALVAPSSSSQIPALPGSVTAGFPNVGAYPLPPQPQLQPPLSRRSPAPDSVGGAQIGNDQRRNSTSSTNSSSVVSSQRKPVPDSEYKYPVSIKPQRLRDYLCQVNPPRILFLDVRTQAQYDNARIKTPFIINIEPIALRDGVSSQQIAEQGLFNRPDSERQLFKERTKFDLVVYYDYLTTEIPKSGPLFNLVQALWDLEYERTERKPVMLEGGFNAWLEVTGMDWVEGPGVDSARKYVPPGFSSANLPNAQQPRPSSPHNYTIYSRMAQGGGINRHDGRIISRTIGDYIRAGDTPQSMVNPKNPEIGVYRPAYPPYATPYSNSTRKSYDDAPPVLLNVPATIIGHGGDKQEVPNGTPAATSRSDGQPVIPTPPGPMVNHGHDGQHQQLSNAEVKLQRRQTIYDNHWNNFGTMERITPSSAAVGGMATHHGPLDAANMLPGTATANGPSLPRPPLPHLSTAGKRPETPPRPLRPLPQPPGMSDLKSYTQFGSGFSKIGSQIGKAGLTNLGNTCFMNSVIQCLIATPPLTRFFLDGSYKRNINLTNPLGTKGKVAEAFAELIRNMWSGQSLVISPTSFRQAIIEFAPQFKGSEQHDSQEFLSFLLDGLHEDLKRENKKAMEERGQQLRRPGEPEEGSEADEAWMESLPEWEASDIAWQRYLRRGNSIVVSIFQGQYKNRLSCTKCGKTSTSYNPFMYLTLPIKAKTPMGKPQTLLSCLDAFIEPEVMEGDNAWHCPRCKKPRKAIKQLTISKLPDVLLIQLKRFASDGPFKNKIKAKVDYPIANLDLTKYLPPRPSPNVPPPPPIRPEQGGNGALVAPPLPPPPTPPALYDLYAVSNHSGEVSNGHYTACVRGETSEHWTNFDDTRVSPCDKSVAVSEHGYTLFYVRKL
ncbi:ubiquitin-specific protease doa4 [Actinomortierella wolfii]|nr:ubiquitin-specific protease doa4 [Actinomortierella wolfii]